MDIGKLAYEISNWADEVFPNRADSAMFLKMYSELAEVIESDGAPDEIADIFIMLLDYAHRKGLTGTRLEEAILHKHEINRKRKWLRDRTGVYSHVKE